MDSLQDKIRLAALSDCTGCSACHDVCPMTCIQMEYAHGLHKYPFINHNECIKCGKCMTVCPVLSPEDNKHIRQKFYASWSKMDEERLRSTSGGIGAALSRYAIEKGWVVYGAAFNEDWGLYHRFAENLEGIEPFRGSKYLQSCTENVLKSVKETICKKKHVFFIGTPCQVEAVKRVVGKKNSSLLITCGIICHGVNSPLVWRDYVSFIEKRYKSKLISYNFRSKAHGWGQDRRGNAKLYITYVFESGKIVCEPAWRNQFHFWFGQHFVMRECCFHCPFRKEYRSADITIGDFWGLSNVLPNLRNSSKGVSVLIASTEQGLNFISECDKIELIPVERDNTIPVLKGLLDKGNEQKKQHEISRKKSFEKEYVIHGFDYMLKKHPHPTRWKKMVSFLKLHLKYRS